MGSFAANDDTHTGGPLREVEDAGELGAVAGLSVGVVSGRPHVFGGRPVELWHGLRKRVSDRVLQAPTGQPAHELVRSVGTIGADQYLLPRPGRSAGQLGEGLLDDVDVIARGVRAGVPGAQLDHQRLTGTGLAVIEERAERVEPGPALVRRGRVLLLGVRGGQGRVEVDDQRVLRRRGVIGCVLTRQRPGAGSRGCTGGVDRREHPIRVASEGRDRARHGRIRRDRPEHARLATERAPQTTPDPSP